MKTQQNLRLLCLWDRWWSCSAENGKSSFSNILMHFLDRWVSSLQTPGFLPHPTPIIFEFFSVYMFYNFGLLLGAPAGELQELFENMVVQSSWSLEVLLLWFSEMFYMLVCMCPVTDTVLNIFMRTNPLEKLSVSLIVLLLSFPMRLLHAFQSTLFLQVGQVLNISVVTYLCVCLQIRSTQWTSTTIMYDVCSNDSNCGIS